MFLCPFQVYKHNSPTLPELLNFPGGGFDITREIGTSYIRLGPLLLNDANGALMDEIESECHGNASEINIKILKQWLQGRGRTPVTWETLVQVLRQANLQGLADRIEFSLA